MLHDATDTSVPLVGDMPKKRRIKKKEEDAIAACTLCRHDHASCDNGRPCKRCTTKGVAHLCNTEFRKRGRPKKKLEQICLGNLGVANSVMDIPIFADSVLEDTFNGNHSAHTSYFPAAPIAVQANDSFLSLLTLPELLDTSNTTTAFVTTTHLNHAPLMSHTSDIPATSDDFDVSSTTTTTVTHVATTTTTTAANTTTPAIQNSEVPTDDDCENMDLVFQGPCKAVDVAKEASDIACLATLAEFAAITGAMKKHKNPPPSADFFKQLSATKDYILNLCDEVSENTLVTFYNKKVSQLKQFYSDLSVPAFVVSAFCTIYVNNAGIELLGSNKDAVKHRFGLFKVLKETDILSVMSRWCTALCDHVNIDKMCVQVIKDDGVLVDCMLSATLHREPFSGAPLLDTFFLLPVCTK